MRYVLTITAAALIAFGLLVATYSGPEDDAPAVPAAAALGLTPDLLGPLPVGMSDEALAWPIKADYSGHSCTYYSKNGNRYAMCWVHTHSVPVSTCPGTHRHHVAGWILTPGGYYSRIRTHDHHMCASPAPHFG